MAETPPYPLHDLRRDREVVFATRESPELSAHLFRAERVLPDFDRDLAAANIAKGLDVAHRHPAIPEAAAAVIVPRLLEHPALENLFACRWDPTTERLVDARWICRGSPSRVAFMLGDFAPGEVAVHNHPGATWPECPIPSEADLDAGANLIQRGVGTAIISNCLGRFVLLHPPRPPVHVAEYRSWRLGTERLGLTLYHTTLRRTER